MKKFEVLKEFKDIHSQEKFVVGSIQEVSDERFEEMTENLAKYDGEFIKEIKQRKRKKKAEQPEEEGA